MLDLDQVWQTIFVWYRPDSLHIGDLADGIMTRKGCEALAVKIVILAIFRNQAIADQLIDE